MLSYAKLDGKARTPLGGIANGIPATYNQAIRIDQLHHTLRRRADPWTPLVYPTLRTVHLRYGEAHTTPFLIVTGHPHEASVGQPIKLDQVGISHLSFTVQGVKALPKRKTHGTR